MDWLNYPKTLLTVGIVIVAVIVVAAVAYIGVAELIKWWNA